MYNGPNSYNYPTYGDYLSAQTLQGQLDAASWAQHQNPVRVRPEALLHGDAAVFERAGSRTGRAGVGAALGTAFLGLPVAAMVLPQTQDLPGIIGTVVAVAAGAAAGVAIGLRGGCSQYTSYGLRVLGVGMAIGAGLSAAFAFSDARTTWVPDPTDPDGGGGTFVPPNVGLDFLVFVPVAIGVGALSVGAAWLMSTPRGPFRRPDTAAQSTF